MNDLSEAVHHELSPIAPVTRARRLARVPKRYLETAAPGTASKRAKTEMQQNQTPNQKAAVGEQTVKQAATINVSPLLRCLPPLLRCLPPL